MWLGVPALRVHRRPLERLDVERDPERLQVLLDQGRLVRVRVGLVRDRQDVVALRRVADPSPSSRTRTPHRLLRRGHVARAFGVAYGS